MITRRHGNLRLRSEPAPAASMQLERDGYAVLRGVLDAATVAVLRDEVAQIFAEHAPDRAHDTGGEFRHAMINRSALSQKAVASPAILEAIEPLLGEDCHVIANTAWRNLPGRPAGRWHIDAGPHVPRAPGVAWPDEIPYPVFAIGMHLFLEDCPREAGPTAVVPGSHRSGSTPPWRQEGDPDPIYEGRGPELRRRDAVCIGRLAPGDGRPAGLGAVLSPGPLRAPGHCPEAADDQRNEPSLRRGGGASGDAARAHLDRAA